jgi:hypothetical protein
MKKCRVKVTWSDSGEVECSQTIIHDNESECYHHKKYFERLSEPCYIDLKNNLQDVDKNHILKVESPERGQSLIFYKENNETKSLLV